GSGRTSSRKRHCCGHVVQAVGTGDSGRTSWAASSRASRKADGRMVGLMWTADARWMALIAGDNDEADGFAEIDDRMDSIRRGSVLPCL
ncbi:hypothetical protein ACLOJK_037293, partial [Asimina triloba]